MSLSHNIKEFVSGLTSLVVGLGVTGKNFALPLRTVHYPWEQVDNIATFRGHVELVPVAGPKGPTKCIACGSCARICPGHCITLTKTKPPKPKEGPDGKPMKKEKAKLATFELDFTYCCLCGLCAEACPKNALRFSNEAYTAVFDRSELEHIDLFARAVRASEGISVEE